MSDLCWWVVAVDRSDGEEFFVHLVPFLERYEAVDRASLYAERYRDVFPEIRVIQDTLSPFASNFPHVRDDLQRRAKRQ